MSASNQRRRPLGRGHFYGLFTAVAAVAGLASYGCSSEPQSASGGASSSSASTTAGAGGDATGSASGGVGGGGTGGSTGSSSGTGGAGGGWDPNAGWTDFKESADTVKIYVSSTDGSDNNDGLSEATPVKTIAKGKSLLRDNHPDWMLLKRGDVWNEPIGTWTNSGKGPDEPTIVSTYGDAEERPLLKTADKIGIFASSQSTINYVAFIGLHLYASTRDPGSPDFVGPEGDEGIRWLATTKSLLIEDMYVQFYESTNITVQGATSDVKIRRNIIADSYNTTADPNAHSQGVYLDGITNLLIEENLFDHNGWNDKVAGGQKTQYNHNMYVQVTCTNLTVINNISVSASSHGLQARPGGLVSGNLFVDDAIGMSFGLVLGNAMPKQGGVTGEITNNIVLSSGDIDPVNSARGLGIQLGNILSAKIEDNIMAHEKSAKPYGDAIDLNVNGSGIHDLTIKNNTIYDWRGGLRFDSAVNFSNILIDSNQIQDPADMTYLTTFTGNISPEITFQANTWTTGNDASKWYSVASNDLSFSQWQTTSMESGGQAKAVKYLAPDRTISQYNASLGDASDYYAFLAEARKQSRKRYLYAYTAKAPMDFIREGFQVVP